MGHNRSWGTSHSCPGSHEVKTYKLQSGVWGCWGRRRERQEPSARCGSPDERACQGEQRPPRVRPCLVRKAGGEPCRPQPPLGPSLSAWHPLPSPWLLISCVTLGKSLDISEFCFLIYNMGVMFNVGASFTGLCP